MDVLRDRDGLKVSAIIPAYNEAKNLLRVLTPLKQSPAVGEIIVVSDGSTDDTALLAERAGVKTLALAQNAGKTKAVLKGAAEAQYPVILLCDADLVNLNVGHISLMIGTYCEGFDMVIMDKGGQPWVFRSLLRSAPAVSGTRILERGHLLRVPFRETDRFQFENRINNHFLAQGLSIAISPGDAIHDMRKYVKYPFLKGLLLDIKGGWQVLASDGPASIPHNLRMFRRVSGLAQAPGGGRKSRR